MYFDIILKMFLIFKLIFFNDEFDIVMDCRIVNVLLVVIGLILIFLMKRMYKLIDMINKIYVYMY